MRLLLLVFLFPVLCVAQDSIRFRDVTIAEGLKMSRAEGKPVFFMGYASWCEHCQKMKAQVFKVKAVADFYNKNFICLWQDMEVGEGKMLHRKFQVKSYPTFVFLDSMGTTLYQFTGERTDSAMIEQGKAALIPEKQFPFLKKQFEADVTNSENCFNYIMALRTAMLDCTEPARKHLATQTDQQLLSVMNWKIIANGVQDVNAREFQFVLSNQKEYAALTSPGRVERKIVNVADEMLNPYMNAKDSAGYFSKRPLAVSMKHPKVDSLVFKYDLTIYERIMNWEEYRKVALRSAEQFAWNNASQLKEICNNFNVHVDDRESLLQAGKWIQRVIELNQEYSSCLLGTRIYKKAGDKKAALEIAHQGKDLAEKYGWDHTEADRLIETLEK